jgi:predicted Rossmann fold flavoprotein
VILTTGGKSYPGSGTTGDGYAWAAALGHTIVTPRPALTPITVAEAWPRELRGVTLPDVGVRILAGNEHGSPTAASDGRPPAEEVLAARRGSLLFTHFGLSGPVVLDVSRVVSGHATPRRLTLELDLAPQVESAAFADWLRQRSAEAGKRLAGSLVLDQTPRRLVDQVLVTAGIPSTRKAAELTREERNRLATACKRLPLALTGTLGFKKAEVTAGGIALAEVDSRTLESKLAPGLHFAGEVLDLDGPIGGYNFQAAWSTGWLAGGSV